MTVFECALAWRAEMSIRKVCIVSSAWQKLAEEIRSEDLICRADREHMVGVIDRFAPDIGDAVQIQPDLDCAMVHLLTTATLDCLRELYPRGCFEVRMHDA